MTRSLEIFLPKNLNEALNHLTEKDVHIIAGGTDVIPGLNQNSDRFKEAGALIDINKISELKGINITGDKISIGAAETFSNLLESEIVKKKLPLLWEAASTIGSVQIRNRATIAGNFVNNAPCADSVPVLLIYNAFLEIESLNSKREISLSAFLNAPYKTNISKDEIVTRINLSLPSEKMEGKYYKLGRRRAVAISRITLALLMSLNKNRIEEIRIASGAVTPIGTRFFNLEKIAEGKELTENFMKDLSRKVGEQIITVTGMRWSSEYKLPVVQQMFYQLLSAIRNNSNTK